jgi:hypothetical protein
MKEQRESAKNCSTIENQRTRHLNISAYDVLDAVLILSVVAIIAWLQATESAPVNKLNVC